ncbi:MAG: hypothetical protein EA350_15430 [Gemmatimonadales bacterium]|nr:MAG: hypothetical protein EA350_15430 [Gemmatimonadales bacterium]
MNRRISPLFTAAVALGGLVVIAGCEVPPSVSAQETPAQQEATAPPPPLNLDTLQLVFEREVFQYPSFQRRNPFAPLTEVTDGPRFEEVELRMVILAADGIGSMATLGLRGADGSRAGAGARSFRVREGDVIGNMRIRAIRLREIVVEVDEFGQRDTRVLELARHEPEARGTDTVPGPPPPDTVGGDAATPPVTPPDTTDTISGNRNGGSE